MSNQYKVEAAAQLWEMFSRHPSVSLTELADLCDHIEATNPQPSFELPDTRSIEQFIRDELSAGHKRMAKKLEELTEQINCK